MNRSTITSTLSSTLASTAPPAAAALADAVAAALARAQDLQERRARPSVPPKPQAEPTLKDLLGAVSVVQTKQRKPKRIRMSREETEHLFEHALDLLAKRVENAKRRV